MVGGNVQPTHGQPERHQQRLQDRPEHDAPAASQAAGDLLVGVTLLLRQASVALTRLDAERPVRSRPCVLHRQDGEIARFFAQTVLPELAARRCDRGKRRTTR